MNGTSHYFNIVDSKIVDITKEQFKDIDVKYDNYEIKNRKELLNDTYTLQRYSKFKQLVESDLNKISFIEKEIYKCQKCNNLVEKFPELDTIHYGIDSNILLLGEAPANNGWRKSHQLWKNIDGKTLPSGIILQKLFNILNKDILEISFIEAIKCYPKERKKLKKRSSNCQIFLKEQIEIMQPKIIIPLGKSATRSILKIDFQKFADVVGRTYYYGNTNVIIVPIYHPSPISPKGYKGNIDIFTNIKNILESEKNYEKL